MRNTTPRTYRLTSDLVAAYAGGPVVCLADAAVGRVFRLQASRPSYDRSRDLSRLASSGADDGPSLGLPSDAAAGPAVARVEIRGPLEQRAGFHDPCAGWTDGYDAIAERMTEAFADGDVFLVVDSPGGAVLGLFECVERVLRAKAQMGRRVTVVIDGMAGSAGYCLAALIADPGHLYLTRASMAGSVGAKAAHVSEAGALAKEGLEVTEFSDPPGKIAMSPLSPLTDLGRARTSRDISFAADTFRAFVESARPKLSRKSLLALDADMLTGASAVAAGLADAVASVEDVEAWALVRAEGEDMAEDEKKDPPADGPPSSKKPDARAEGDDEQMGCKRCGEMPGEGARYCAKCGAKVAEDDEQPDSSKRPEAMVARGSTASYGAMSVPALRSACVAMHRSLDRVAALVGVKTHGEIEGATEAVARDAAKAKRYREERNAARAQAEAKERVDLLLSLANAGVHPRGELLVDIVNDAGRVTGLRPAALWGDGPEGRTMANLRGYARARLDAQPANERSPYDKAPPEPDPKRAEERPANARAEAAKIAPAVQAAAKSGVPIDQAAAIYAREFGGSQ